MLGLNILRPQSPEHPVLTLADEMLVLSSLIIAAVSCFCPVMNACTGSLRCFRKPWRPQLGQELHTAQVRLQVRAS